MRPEEQTGRKTTEGAARERLLETAYGLFSEHTLHTVGVDRIVAEADVAKTTLYRHFPSKDDLVVSVLQRHQDVWMSGWLEQVVARTEGSPGAKILALFDAFDEWFRRDDYHGCLFARSLLEMRSPDSPVRDAAVSGLANIRALVRELAEAAGAPDPDAFALQIQLLMVGSTVVAVSGLLDAARHARDAARVLLERAGVAVEL